MKRTLAYTTCRGLHIAYEVLGEGPPDLLLLDDWFSHLDLEWEDPYRARVLRLVASSARVIRFDKSGMGLSDRVPPASGEAMECWAEEAVAALDACGVDRVRILAQAFAGPLGVTLAARLGDRVERLALATAFASLSTSSGVATVDPAVAAAGRTIVMERWGTGVISDVLGQRRDTLPDHQVALDARLERASVARRDIRAVVDGLFLADAVPLLERIRASTLVAHRDNPLLPAAHAEALATRIPNATLELLDADWHYPLAEDDVLADVLACLAYLTGSSVGSERNREFLTFVFQDIVGSTAMVERLGDREWSDALKRLTAALHLQLGHYRGRLIDQAGDGYFTAFDNPRRAVRFACDVAERALTLGITLRTGVHVGECHLDGDEVRGMSVHAAARIMGAANGGDVLVSAAVRELLRDVEFCFALAGTRELRGVPGEWTLYRVETATAESR